MILLELLFFFFFFLNYKHRTSLAYKETKHTDLLRCDSWSHCTVKVLVCTIIMYFFFFQVFLWKKQKKVYNEQDIKSYFYPNKNISLAWRISCKQLVSFTWNPPSLCDKFFISRKHDLIFSIYSQFMLLADFQIMAFYCYAEQFTVITLGIGTDRPLQTV